MRLMLLARHGQSVFNVAGVVNGDPQLDRGLSPLGIEQAHQLHWQIAGVPIDLCVVSEFPRAQQTADIALEGRDDIAWEIDPDLNDVRIGELEGQTLDDYRRWKDGHDHSAPFPGGESLDDAADRYAAAYQRLLDRDEETILCVCHEIPVRHAINAAAGSDDLDWPVHSIANAAPYLVDAAALERTARRLAQEV
jgi:broad specificity phosphatase PhoE